MASYGGVQAGGQFGMRPRSTTHWQIRGTINQLDEAAGWLDETRKTMTIASD